MSDDAPESRPVTHRPVPIAATMGTITEQKFNDDLLLTENDRALARSSFPKLADTLDFDELRDLFVRYDTASNRAKKGRRRAGIIAIVLGGVALLGASAEPVYSGIPASYLPFFGGLFATLGIVGVLIGAFGVLGAESKHQWLCGRLMTERLRQFHFQTLVCHPRTVLASITGPAAAAEFTTLRRQWLRAFELEHEGHLTGKLNDVLADNTEEDFWLHETESPPEAGHVGLTELFSAYRLLRFQHQLQYANYKLRDAGLSALRQVTLLRQVSWLSILIIFVLHLLMALSMVAGAKDWLTLAGERWVHVLVVWTAIAALAARALEEGLQPAREVERYSRYRSVLARLLYHFDHAVEPDAKFAIMRQTERAVYQEMRSFLTINHEARFVL